jgi:4-amino-4-deoxy-L-arabinose transferase-like glycosyltransferase
MNALTSSPLRESLKDRGVVAALVVAFAFRIVLAVIVFGPLHYYVVDSHHYVASGTNLFQHGTFAIVCDPHCIPSLMRPPAYPVLVGLVLAVFKLPEFTICILQACFDTVTTWLVATFGMKLDGLRVGRAAAFLYALNPFAAAYAGQIMTESIATFAVIASAYVVWRLTEPTAPHSKLRAWAALGALLGLTTMVRPALGALPAAMALAAFRPSLWKRQLAAWSVAAVAFALIIAPWTARNWFVTREGEADDSFRMVSSFLGPNERRLMTPGFTEWFKTYEEPYASDGIYLAPTVAKYFLPGERERVAALFAKIRENLGTMPTDERPGPVVITPDLDAKFSELARERREAHPFRTTVFPPLSRAPRLWFSPRLTALEIKPWRLGGTLGLLLIAAATAYNGVQVLLGIFGGILTMRTEIAARILASVPIYLTLFHSLYAVGGQSRYSVPGIPEVAVFAAVGLFAVLDRLRRRWREWGPHSDEVVSAS